MPYFFVYKLQTASLQCLLLDAQINKILDCIK